MVQTHGGRSVSVRGLLAALRKRGIALHAGGLAGDDAIIAQLGAAHAKAGGAKAPPAAGAGLAGLREKQLAAVEVTTETTPSASAWFGVDRARFAPRSGTAADAAIASEYGDYVAVLSDVAQLGGGFFREGMQCDLHWNDLLPATEIPKPVDLLERLRDDGFACYREFENVLLLAIILKIRLLPMVFCEGGGGGLSPSQHTKKEGDQVIYATTPVTDPATGVVAPDNTSWYEVQRGKPDHQSTVLIPTAMGWNAWYWEPYEVCGRQRAAYNRGMRGVDAFHIKYQRYALNVYNADDNNDPMRASTYRGRCALRKSMALTAFGQATGELLAIWDEALKELSGTSLLDHVPYLELGAELSCWEADDATSTNDEALNDDVKFRASTREFARFHAALALGLRTGWPSARFKAAELASWADVDRSKILSSYLGRMVTTGLSAEATLMNRVSADGWAASADASDFADFEDDFPYAADWVEIALDGGVALPIDGTTVAARDLVHCVGFHWFHYWDASDDPEQSGDLGYQGETDLADKTLAPFQARVLDAAADAGIALAWGVGNVGFPSGVPRKPIHPTDNFPPTQLTQAVMVVRLLLTFRALGAEHVLAYSHMGNLEGAAGEFALMGLRNDAVPVTADYAATTAYPKAAYWAFQRLMALTQHARAIEVVLNEDGLVVLRLCAKTVGFPGATTGPLSRWSYAYVFWLDHTSPLDTATLRLSVDAAGFERLALTPASATRLWRADSPYAVAMLEPAWDEADPTAARFGSCTQDWAQVGSAVDVQIYQTKADSPLLAKSNLGLVAWFTNTHVIVRHA